MIPPADQGETARQIAERIAYERGPIEEEWSSNHSCGSYGCCGGGKDIDRAELARVIESSLAQLRAEHERLQECERAIIESHDAASAELNRLRAEHDNASSALAAWMMAHGYATGHGDSIEALLEELAWQHAERFTQVAQLRAEHEGLKATLTVALEAIEMAAHAGYDSKGVDGCHYCGFPWAAHDPEGCSVDAAYKQVAAALAGRTDAGA